VTGHHHASPAQTPLRLEPEVTFANSISSLGTRLADWVTTAVDYYTAAAIYQQLSRLSDAELRRRGFSRATLASEICQACDRGKFRDGQSRTAMALQTGPDRRTAGARGVP
jgi:hypothetical protein